MERSRGTRRSIDGQTILRTAAIAASVPDGMATGVASASAAAGPSFTAATWNLSLGADLTGPARVSSTAELRETVGELLAEARRHPYEARMEAVAAEVEHIPASGQSGVPERLFAAGSPIRSV